MIRLLLTRKDQYLSTSKNYANSFKIRSKLADFFKHVHPDQMQQAPAKVKQENLRSLKNFNSYIDSINQQKPCQAKLLKFYVAEKINHKSKKFFSFTLQLPQLKVNQAKLSQQKSIKLMDNIVTIINKKFKQSQNINNKTSEKKIQNIIQDQEIKIQTQQERVQRLQATIQPFNKKQRQKDQLLQKQLKSTINSKYLQSERDMLMGQLKKNVSFADTATNKPMMWSRLIMQQTGIYNDYQQILSNLIDPKLIFFQQTLTIDQIQQFKKKLLPGSLNHHNYKQTKQMTQICKQMEQQSPPLCFYVTKHYSGTQIPGFFSIPYNFKISDLYSKFHELKQRIIQQRNKYQQYYDYYIDFKKKLKQQNNIIITLEEQFKNNNDIWIKIVNIKRLEKYKFNQMIEIVLLNHSEIQIFREQYHLHNNQSVYWYNSKIIISLNFKDIEFDNILKQHLNINYKII